MSCKVSRVRSMHFWLVRMLYSCAAIREHYMPTSADGELPDTKVGAVLALADKLDTILSFFSSWTDSEQFPMAICSAPCDSRCCAYLGQV